MSTHAKYSPSSLPRLFACPGSLQQCEGIDEPEDSEASIRGTYMHEVCERALIVGNDIDDMGDVELSAEEREICDLYIDYVRGLS